LVIFKAEVSEQLLTEAGQQPRQHLLMAMGGGDKTDEFSD
jgi:hypothetical protein